MAALPRRFGPDVSDTIMRFAVGYPRDRLRDMGASIKRKEKGRELTLDPNEFCVRWRTPWRNFRMLFIGGRRTFEHAVLDDDREAKVEDLAFTCDACEPVELELQRTRL